MLKKEEVHIQFLAVEEKNNWKLTKNLQKKPKQQQQNKKNPKHCN